MKNLHPYQFANNTLSERERAEINNISMQITRNRIKIRLLNILLFIALFSAIIALNII